LTVNFDKIEKIISSIQSINQKAKLLIVTKNRSEEDIKKLLDNHFFMFGENRVQEAKKKFENLPDRHKISLHLIGNLQSNKVQEALKLFDVIQSIDRPKIIYEIVKILKKNDSNFRTKEFFIQVNIGGEEQKSGVAISDLGRLYKLCCDNNINITGLMCIPPNDDDSKFYFKKMSIIRNSIDKNLKLSMGMSQDYKEALMEGSDLIRVGSMIFEKDI